MTEEKKDIQETSQNIPQPIKKVYGESRGRYTMLDGAKVFHFDFPIASSIEENFAAIAFIKEEIFKAIEAKEKESKKKELPDDVKA